MLVHVQTSLPMMGEAIVDLLRSIGHPATTDGSGNPTIVLADLIGTTSPYPLPGALPTVAVANVAIDEAVELMIVGYAGYVSSGVGPTVLAAALSAVARSELWAPRVVLARTVTALRIPAGAGA